MEIVYDEKVQSNILQEFTRSKDGCYLDHAGATLYSEVQIKNIFDDLRANIYGNPHSLNHTSKQCSDLVDLVRRRILKHFHTTCEEYTLIFTSGATAAIKLLLENFDWTATHEKSQNYNFCKSQSLEEFAHSSGAYIYSQSNHTSIVGGREIAKANRIPFFCIEQDELNSLMSNDIKQTTKYRIMSNSLFAYPAQCNFSGKKYPLEWIKKVQSGLLDYYGTGHNIKRNSRWFCLLDAATYCSTNDLNLSEVHPDFVCISFYKIFGYPTGLGALLVRNSSAFALNKAYCGGGTVEILLPFQNFHRKRRILHERFEDGTIPFLSIIALDHGLNTLNRLNLNMTVISRHVFQLARYTVKKLKALKHWNGTEAVQLYSDTYYDDVQTQGGIVNFNLKRANCQYIGFTEVLHMANLRKIYVRTGCFCNLGACQRYLKMDDTDLKLYYQAGHVCGDTKDLIDGKPTGSIRISFGYMSTQRDVEKLIEMIQDYFIEIIPQNIPKRRETFDLDAIKLSMILLFPIKSCGAMEVTSWKLNQKGLEYDREWMIITSSGVCLTQKQEPKLCLVRPMLNLKKNTLTLAYGTGSDTITISITSNTVHSKYDLCESKVCNTLIQARDCGDDVSIWLSSHLNIHGLRLVRQDDNDIRHTKASKNMANKDEKGVKLSLSNQAQFLLINNESVRWLQQSLDPEDSLNFHALCHRFRGNFYIEGAAEFSENNWKHLTVGSAVFKVDGPCGRCQIICIDQKTGEKNRKPLVALSRALNGKLQFGIYLSRYLIEDDIIISVGDPLLIK